MKENLLLYNKQIQSALHNIKKLTYEAGLSVGRSVKYFLFSVMNSVEKVQIGEKKNCEKNIRVLGHYLTFAHHC